MGSRWFWVLLVAGALHAAEYSAPAGIRPVIRRPSGPSIIPGGRIVAPAGRQCETGPDPLGLAVSPDGRTVVSLNSGSARFSLTVLESDKEGNWTVRNLVEPPREETAADRSELRGIFMGLAFSGEHSVYASEGSTGLVRLVDLSSGATKRTYDLNQDGMSGSFSGDLAFVKETGVLYVLDLAHARLVSIDARRHRIASSTSLGGLPSAISVSADKLKAYVTTADSLCVLSLREPSAPVMEARVPARSPSGVLAAAGRVFVSNAREDSVAVLDPATNAVADEIGIRIPGMEKLRGVKPAGMAYDESSGWLLVAEAGINAMAVIDTRRMRVIGQVPAAWFPVRVAVDRGAVYVANAKGQGVGPTDQVPVGIFAGTWRRGSISTFPLPDASRIAAGTATVMEANGFEPRPQAAAAYPAAIRHVVLIVKENRTFDEVFGDVARAANGAVMGMPELARFGRSGWAYGGRERLSLKDVNVTPNHHALAARWSFSDNFYAGLDISLDWIVPHLERQGISFRKFGEDPAPNTRDQDRASQFIQEIERTYAKGGQPLPRFLSIYLPDDRMDQARPAEGYPYEASYMAENDYALGRIVEYLSHSPWWREMAIFVTEAGTNGGVDHIDAHRSILLGIGPHCRRNYVSHVHTGFPGLLKTIFSLLGAPPLSLFDAAASDLRDCFTATPDDTPYQVMPEDSRLYAPAASGRP